MIENFSEYLWNKGGREGGVHDRFMEGRIAVNRAKIVIDLCRIGEALFL